MKAKSLIIATITLTAIFYLKSTALAEENHDHNGAGHSQHDKSTEEKQSSRITVTGEVLDLACYIDHGAMGAKHADCAATCIKSGLPVGIKSASDGKVYMLIGEHKPMNQELAKYAAKSISVTGKLVVRDGMNLLANAEIIKP
jgi:hypothetical protein